ncbi:lipase family protein [Streptomyces sp. NPDC020965]|uniref:lipase family protein n=1 Tax=Streptomyces sp. NPDC020965 TaxID=3365105 RepID=UPI0037BC436B
MITARLNLSRHPARWASAALALALTGTLTGAAWPDGSPTQPADRPAATARLAPNTAPAPLPPLSTFNSSGSSDFSDFSDFSGSSGSSGSLAGHDSRPAPGSGKLLKATPLPASDRPHGGPGQSIEYISTGFTGRAVTVSGLLFAPAGKPPRGGWPAISLAHGTVGVANACAPSRSAPGLPHDPAVRAWLDSGVAVLATDYEGLGTPGPHPYMHGRSAAFGTIDIVRAARQANRGISKTWVAMGHSQGGHAAIHAAAHATRYAPGLDFRGAVATAPPTDFTRLLADRSDSASEERTMRTALYPLITAGLRAIDRDLDFRHLFSERARELVSDARSKCFWDLVLKVRAAGLHEGNVWERRPETVPGMMDALREHVNTPVVRLDRPLFVAQGAKDEIIQAPLTARYAEQLRRAGSDVVYRQYATADHVTVLKESAPEITGWIKQRLARS